MKNIYIYEVDLNQRNLILVGINKLQELSVEEISSIYCINIDLLDKTIYKPSLLVTQLKFWEWDDSFSDIEEKEILEKVYQTFSEQEIEEKIIKPLSSVESIIWPLPHLVYNLVEFKNYLFLQEEIWISIASSPYTIMY